MKRRRRVWLVVTVITVAMLVNSVQLILAGTQGTQCSPSDHEKSRLWENATGDTSDGNDSIWLCGSGYSDLGAIAHTLPGDCHGGGLIGSSTWSDCGNGASIWIPAGQHFCAYSGTGYGGAVLIDKNGPQTGTRFDFTPDIASSIRVTSNAC